jgi:hypothetical protein
MVSEIDVILKKSIEIFAFKIRYNGKLTKVDLQSRTKRKIT